MHLKQVEDIIFLGGLLACLLTLITQQEYKFEIVSEQNNQKQPNRNGSIKIGYIQGLERVLNRDISYKFFLPLTTLLSHLSCLVLLILLQSTPRHVCMYVLMDE